VTDDQQPGPGDDRLDVDIHHASAGHSHAQQFILHVESDQRALFALDAFPGLAAHRALGAASPTQPVRMRPSAPIEALEPRPAEEEPSTRTTVATANDRRCDVRSAALE